MNLAHLARRLFDLRSSATGRDRVGDAWKRASARLRAAATEHDSVEREPADPAVLDLNVPFPADGVPVSLRATAERLGPPPPEGLAALRAAVAEPLAARPDDVLVTHGAGGAYRTVLDAFVDPGRPVVLLAPCSPLFASAARSRRARVRWVPTRVEDGRLRLDFDALSRAMRGAAVLAVADPGNPIGLPLADDDADRLRWTAERSDVLLYVDETFARFRGDHAARRLAELAPARTLVAGSLTAVGHGSLRVGWLTGSAALVRACGLAQRHGAGPVPAVCQQLAWRVLMTDPPGVEGVNAARRETAGRLRGMGLAVEVPADGYFLWVEVGECGRTFAERLLTAEGVRVGAGERYGPGGERFVRLSAAADPGRLREGLNRLARFVGAPARPVAPLRPTAPRRPAFSRG